jgi:hypothetical protein
MVEPEPNATLHRYLQMAREAWWDDYRDQVERAAMQAGAE